MTKHAGNEPSEAQVEAAALAMHRDTGPRGGYGWTEYLSQARAALVAAQGAAPQAFKPCAHVVCLCTPVLPSSTVDEDALAEVLSQHVLGAPNGGTASWAWLNCSCAHRIEIAGVTREHVVALGHKHQARAVAEWFKEQGR